jgi:hypothetical protein
MPDISPLARALGRVPSGLFIVTANAATGPIGFLGSFVMQTGFEPPTLVVAVGKGRPHLDAIRAAGRFGVSVLDKQSSPLMGATSRRRRPHAAPWCSRVPSRGSIVGSSANTRPAITSWCSASSRTVRRCATASRRPTCVGTGSRTDFATGLAMRPGALPAQPGQQQQGDEDDLDAGQDPGRARHREREQRRDAEAR